MYTKSATKNNFPGFQSIFKVNVSDFGYTDAQKVDFINDLLQGKIDRRQLLEYLKSKNAAPGRKGKGKRKGRGRANTGKSGRNSSYEEKDKNGDGGNLSSGEVYIVRPQELVQEVQLFNKHSGKGEVCVCSHKDGSSEVLIPQQPNQGAGEQQPCKMRGFFIGSVSSGDEAHPSGGGGGGQPSVYFVPLADAKSHPYGAVLKDMCNEMHHSGDPDAMYHTKQYSTTLPIKHISAGDIDSYEVISPRAAIEPGKVRNLCSKFQSMQADCEEAAYRPPLLPPPPPLLVPNHRHSEDKHGKLYSKKSRADLRVTGKLSAPLISSKSALPDYQYGVQHNKPFNYMRPQQPQQKAKPSPLKLSSSAAYHRPVYHYKEKDQSDNWEETSDSSDTQTSQKRCGLGFFANSRLPRSCKKISAPSFTNSSSESSVYVEAPSGNPLFSQQRHPGLFESGDHNNTVTPCAGQLVAAQQQQQQLQSYFSDQQQQQSKKCNCNNVQQQQRRPVPAPRRHLPVDGCGAVDVSEAPNVGVKCSAGPRPSSVCRDASSLLSSSSSSSCITSAVSDSVMLDDFCKRFDVEPLRHFDEAYKGSDSFEINSLSNSSTYETTAL